MTILKIEIDTDDLGLDEDGYGKSFEDVFHETLKHEISNLAFNKLKKEHVESFANLVKETVSESVEIRIMKLLSEEIAISGKWGEKKFIGSVEDYIKREIDGKYLHPVNTNGKRLEGCTTEHAGDTWINWKLNNLMHEEFKRLLSRAENNIEQMVANTIKTQLDTYSEGLIEEKVRAKLLEVGVKL